jgi:hypothetical protein
LNAERAQTLRGQLSKRTEGVNRELLWSWDQADNGYWTLCSTNVEFHKSILPERPNGLSITDLATLFMGHDLPDWMQKRHKALIKHSISRLGERLPDPSLCPEGTSVNDQTMNDQSMNDQSMSGQTEQQTVDPLSVGTRATAAPGQWPNVEFEGWNTSAPACKKACRSSLVVLAVRLISSFSADNKHPKHT